MWCARKLGPRMAWAYKPACIVLFSSSFVCNQPSKKVEVQTRPWSRSDTLIKIIMKSSSILYAQLQVAHQIEVLSNNRTSFFQGFQDVTCSASFGDSGDLVGPQSSLLSWRMEGRSSKERLLYFCKRILLLNPFTDNFVFVLPEGHRYGQIPISLIITLGKPLKNLISFHHSPSL